jgi:uncharacterized protein (TIGR02246 family)
MGCVTANGSNGGASMKKSFVLLALACVVLAGRPNLATGQGAVQIQSGRDHEVLFAAVNDWKMAYNSGDASKVAALYTEDAYYRTAHMFARGRQAIEVFCRRGIDAGEQINFVGPFMVYASGDFGYAAADYQVTRAEGTVNGRAVLIFRKANGAWLITAHETLLPGQS